MERTSVQKLARVLRVLVMIALVCNIVTLLLVPGLANLFMADSWEELAHDWGILGFGNLLKFFALCWWPILWIMALIGEVDGGTYWLVLTLFLLACGTCTAVILWQARRVLDTILKGNPFVKDNAKSMKRAAICCFLISGAALARLIWGFAYYQSIAPLLSYNALFIPIFLMGGLLFLVMSALFRQAAELKAENDLTI